MGHSRHVNEFLKTSFANSGRVAGMGITYDRYDEESGTIDYESLHRDAGKVECYPKGYFEDPSRMDGPVIIIQEGKKKKEGI